MPNHFGPHQKLKGNEIRVLRFTPALDAQYLCCGLAKISLDAVQTGVSPESYHALSYAWGDAAHHQHASKLACDSFVVSITPNLHSALVNIWLNDPDALLWVDAICIDQSNTDERNHQVSLMSEIFGRATTVKLWLGDLPQIDVQRRTKTMELIAKAGEMPQYLLDRQKSLLVQVDGPVILNILQCAWFSRVWCLQEFVLAKEALVHIGPHSMKWSIFVHACSNFCQKARPGPLKKSGRILQVLKSCRLHHAANQMSLKQLLQETRFREATDPRDRVFAVLGLLKNPPFQPDYSWSLSRTFATATWACLEESKSLAFLEYAGLTNRSAQCTTQNDHNSHERSVHYSAPTWVVDLQYLRLRNGVHRKFLARSLLIQKLTSPVMEINAAITEFTIASILLGRLTVYSAVELSDRRCFLQGFTHVPSHHQFRLEETFETGFPPSGTKLLDSVKQLGQQPLGDGHLSGQMEVYLEKLPSQVRSGDWYCIFPGGVRPWVVRSVSREADSQPKARLIGVADGDIFVPDTAELLNKKPSQEWLGIKCLWMMLTLV